jgi:hypothetical protein
VLSFAIIVLLLFKLKEYIQRDNAAVPAGDLPASLTPGRALTPEEIDQYSTLTTYSDCQTPSTTTSTTTSSSSNTATNVSTDGGVAADDGGGGGDSDGDEIGEICSVCICEFEDGDELRTLQCGHVYHKECIDQWLSTLSTQCPMCKQDVRSGRRLSCTAQELEAATAALGDDVAHVHSPDDENHARVAPAPLYDLELAIELVQLPPRGPDDIVRDEREEFDAGVDEARNSSSSSSSDDEENDEFIVGAAVVGGSVSPTNVVNPISAVRLSRNGSRQLVPNDAEATPAASSPSSDTSTNDASARTSSPAVSQTTRIV